MSTHNICFYGEIRKISVFLKKKNALIWSLQLDFDNLDRQRTIEFCFSVSSYRGLNSVENNK